MDYDQGIGIDCKERVYCPLSSIESSNCRENMSSL